MISTLVLLILLSLSLAINLILIKHNKELKFRKRSLAVKYGKFSEQFFPFIEEYPYDSSNFRFIGTPIDGVQFEDDRIILVEFKVGSSKLSPKERKIKELVDSKRVYFEEFRIDNKNNKKS